MLPAEVRASLSGVLVSAAREHNGRALPIRDLVALAGKLPGGTDVTIDFTAAAQPGNPLVLVRLPPGSQFSRFDALTPREREVAAWVAAGLPNREIAARLWLTTATVKDHVHRILAKTGLSNRTALAAVWQGDERFRESRASATSA